MHCSYHCYPGTFLQWCWCTPQFWESIQTLPCSISSLPTRIHCTRQGTLWLCFLYFYHCCLTFSILLCHWLSEGLSPTTFSHPHAPAEFPTATFSLVSSHLQLEEMALLFGHLLKPCSSSRIRCELTWSPSEQSSMAMATDITHNKLGSMCEETISFFFTSEYFSQCH